MKVFGRVVFFVSALLLVTGCGDEPEPKTSQPKLNTQLEETAIDWPTYGGQSSGTQYSSLDQINRENVDTLKRAWVFHTGDLSNGDDDSDATNYQVTPIFADDKLIFCTPYNNVVALNPGTGDPVWRFDFNKPKSETMYGYHNCRGVSYWVAANESEANDVCGKRVIQATDNGVLMALDATTGKLCAGFGDAGKVDLNALDYRGEGRISVTSPPAIYQDVVVVGGTVIDNKYEDSLDGIVRGFDARTGEQRWAWNPIPEKLSSQVGGANTWAPISVDRDTGTVFLPTGSPSYDTYGVNRTDPIPFGNAVVALDALTGEVTWSYQTVHHDLWDYDLASMPTLGKVMHEGVERAVVFQGTKTGFVFVLDRKTGEPVFDVVEQTVPSSDVPGEFAFPTQPHPTKPPPVTSQKVTVDDAWGVAVVDKRSCKKSMESLRNEGMFTPPSNQGSVLHPSFLGGINWGGLAFDAASGLAVVNSSNLMSSVTLVPRDVYKEDVHKVGGASVYEMRGAPYIMVRKVLLSSFGAPCNPPPWGTLTALDMNAGEIRWQIPFGRVDFGALDSLASWGAPNQGGPIVTKGGLVFIGASLDSKFQSLRFVQW